MAKSSLDLAREQWRNRMAWSMMGAVALHAGLLAAWPTWQKTTPILDPAVVFQDPIWISPYDAPILAEGPGPEGPESGARAGDSEVEGAGAEEGMGRLSSALRDRIVQGTSRRPTVSGPFFGGGGGSPPTPTEGTGASGVGIGDGGGPSTVDLATLQGLSALDLERLAGVRPEIALQGSSSWMLIQNPVEIKEFMNRRVSAELDPGVSGSVSVALWISATGSVEWAEVIRSSGRSDMDDIALTLFTDVVAFSPARLGTSPIPMSAIYTVHFPW